MIRMVEIGSFSDIRTDVAAMSGSAFALFISSSTVCLGMNFPILIRSVSAVALT